MSFVYPVGLLGSTASGGKPSASGDFFEKVVS